MRVTTEQAEQRVRGTSELFDDFSDRRPRGAVIGSRSTCGHRRLGVDAEGVLSIDNGALRIAPLVEAGFGRIVLGYGPVATWPGLAFAVYMLNGHNTAQAEPLPDTFRQRLNSWLRGSRTESTRRRLMQWLFSGRVRRVLRQFRRWKRSGKGGRPVALLDENLAVGWFASADTPDPRVEGNAFIMHALGPENGELWVGNPSSRTRSLRGVQNLPLYFVAIMRGKGTVYYVASLDGAPGLAPYPWLRPVGVDSTRYPEQAYVGIHQSVLGQIGWRLDTRVQGIRVAGVAGYEAWCGGAHAADRLSRAGGPASIEGEVGGPWQILTEGIRGAGAGAGDHSSATMAVLDPAASSGLILAVATPGKDTSKRIGLVWRCLDERNHWRLEIGSGACEVICVTEGKPHVVLSQALGGSAAWEYRLQVLDDGHRMRTYVNGEPMTDEWIMDPRLKEATKVGVLFHEPVANEGTIHSFEAHPRRFRLPDLLDMGGPWLRTGDRVVIADDFSGKQADLDGRETPVGRARWKRVIGDGVIELDGRGSARVRGSPQEPCPGRTAYCVDWPHADFVDLEVTITPPGNRIGHGQRTTAGFIIYQDSRNYMTLNAYRADYYGGGSVSTFFKFNGFEDIYDAIWSNVGNRVTYGKPLRLRLCCDGERYLVFIDDEPVLYRAFRDVYPDVGRLRIGKVGILANWEFGTDTGSTFEQFKLRA